MDTIYRFKGCDPCWYCTHRAFDDKGFHIIGGCGLDGPTLVDVKPCPQFKASDLPSDDLVDELLNEQPRYGKAFVFDRCMDMLLAVVGDVARGYDPDAAEVLIGGLCALLKEIQIKSLVGGLGSTPWLDDIGRTEGYGAWLEWRKNRMLAEQKKEAKE